MALYCRGQWSWDGRIRSELHVDPRTLSLRDLVQSMYYLLSKQVNSEYGKLLEHIELPDPCLLIDVEPGEKSDEYDAYYLELCASKRLTDNVQLNQWLVGLYDGRFWVDGWAPEDK